MVRGRGRVIRRRVRVRVVRVVRVIWVWVGVIGAWDGVEGEGSD